MIEILGLIFSLFLLIFLTLRGMHLLLAAPLAAVSLGLFHQMSFFATDPEQLNVAGSFMNGFSGFIQSWFLVFLAGSLFGKVMHESGCADSLATAVVDRLGSSKAALAVILACAFLTYGGVSVFVVAFAVYPVAIGLFQKANLPRRFIPAALSFGSVTFTMTSAGSPEIQNWIPTKHLGTSPYAAWEVSLIIAVLMATLGFFWLNRMIKKAVDSGEEFESRVSDPQTHQAKTRLNFFFSLLPLLTVFVASALLHKYFEQNALVMALLLGLGSAWWIGRKNIQEMGQALSISANGAILAIANTVAVVGFGNVAKTTSSFQAAVGLMTDLPGPALLGAAVAVSVIAGLTGSASGGQSLALPLLAPHYLGLGVDPEQLHRIVSLSSGAIDSLPHNGYVVTTIRSVCGESHSSAYGPVAKLTVLIPLLGTFLAIAFFLIGEFL